MSLPSRAIRLGTVLALGTGACQNAPPSERLPVSEDRPAEGPATATLADIMQDLATDMAAAAGGIWIADAEQVAVAAQRIADHPKVSPEDRAMIQAALGEGFGAFVTFDQEVHGAAIELADAAAGGSGAPDLLASYSRIQEGCVGCHDAFRADVASALGPPVGGDR